MATSYRARSVLYLETYTEDAVLFHEPSASLILLTPGLARLLEALTPTPISAEKLCQGLAPDEADEAGRWLDRLAQEGIIERLEDPECDR